MHTTHSLTDSQLLAHALIERPGPIDVHLAESWFSLLGGWEGFLQMPFDQWPPELGANPWQRQRVEVFREVFKRARAASLPPSPLHQMVRYLRDVLPAEQEGVAAAFLHADSSLIRVKEIFRGAVGECFAQPREILREAMKANAARLIVAHNHVGGALFPSDSDVRFTARLDWAANLVGIPLRDHVIVGQEGQFFSFEQAGLLRRRLRPRRRARGSL